MYKGGKAQAGCYQWIINQIPPHTRYIEAYKLVRDNFRVGNIDVMEYLRNHYRYEKGDFIYLDPPYLFSTRSSQQPIYKHEFGTEREHQELLCLLRSLQCNIAISGYASDLYSDILYDWRVTTFRTTKRSGKPALEHLWMNYDEPTALHDYRYLGNNYREREKIKRQQNRWRERLTTMDAQQRYAMLSVIQEL